MENNKLKILLATGIYPPDIGGPATYVKTLAEELPQHGCEVKVVTYTNEVRSKKLEVRSDEFLFRVSRKQNIFLRYFKYFIEMQKLAKWADVVYAFDIMSSGLPAIIAAKLRGKKFIVRIGGDWLWEKVANSGRTAKPLAKYYQEPKSFKEKYLMPLNRFVLKRADKIIFTVEWLKDIYHKYYCVLEEKTVIINNPFPDKTMPAGEAEIVGETEFIYAGRLLPLKNLERLVEAVAKIPRIKLRIVGDGPTRDSLAGKIEELGLAGRVIIEPGVPHDELMEKIKKVYAFILPSLSEVSPNLVLECIALGKPIIATRECGYYERFHDQLVFIDPEDTEDIINKIEYLLDKNNYESSIQKIKSIDTSYSWKQVAEAHLQVFKNII